MAHPEVVALLEQLVAARSPSREEGPVVGVLKSWWSTQLAAQPENLRGSLHIEDRNLSVLWDTGVPGPTLMVCSHHDTVPATTAWTRDPWRPTIENGRMYGLGANDAKASVAAMAIACRDAKISRGKLLYVAVCEEEVGRGGLEKYLPQLGRIDAAIIGEPTGLEIATAQSGLLVLDCTNSGRAGHAARPHLAENPIYALARDVLALESLPLDRLHPLAGKTTCAVTVLSAGERHNVIPAEARYTVDLRPTPAYTPAELVAIVKNAVSANVHVRSDRFRPVATPDNAAILAAARLARPQAKCFASPTLSDWAHIPGVPAIKWGPGLSEVSHTADEWVDLSMVAEAVQVYKTAIEHYFLMDIA